MSQKKILNLLLSLVFLINYINFFQKDRDQLSQKINLIKNKIEVERYLNKIDMNISSLKIDTFQYFFDQNKTYSQSMGDMQEMINKAAKHVCNTTYIKWSQIPTSNQWYQYLKFEISLTCKPSEIFNFINNLKKEKKLMVFQKIHINKVRKKEFIKFHAKLIGFKVRNEK